MGIFNKDKANETREMTIRVACECHYESTIEVPQYIIDLDDDEALEDWINGNLHKVNVTELQWDWDKAVLEWF